MGENVKLQSFSEDYKTGLKIRREVLGDVYVDHALTRGEDSFTAPLEDYLHTTVWSSWARPDLSRQQRSLITISIAIAQGRDHELATHVRGALRNGVKESEISETIRHCMLYVGAPAGVAAYTIAGKVVKDVKEERGRPQDGKDEIAKHEAEEGMGERDVVVHD